MEPWHDLLHNLWTVAGVEQTFSHIHAVFPHRLNGLATLSVKRQLAQKLD